VPIVGLVKGLWNGPHILAIERLGINLVRTSVVRTVPGTTAVYQPLGSYARLETFLAFSEILAES
jgi:hypothetical protein